MASTARTPVIFKRSMRFAPAIPFPSVAVAPVLARSLSSSSPYFVQSTLPATPKRAPAVIDFTHTPVPNLKTLQEGGLAVEQAPNNAQTWSKSQRPRSMAYRGVRFEQTDLSKQPQPLSAQALIAEEPVRVVHGRKAVCDGGGGALGHPKVYIPLDIPGEVVPC
ncbi:hypothetical protein HDU93_004448, partial [Gonapodya sp. JEL0774]